MPAGRVCVVLVNYGDPADTLECLDSLFRMDYPDFRVVVCDNGSTEASRRAILDWAAGRREAPIAGETGRRLLPGRLARPIPCATVDAEAVDAGVVEYDAADPADAPMVLIRSDRNRGFAGGCNLGLRVGMARAETAWFWLLNNDTAVMPDALGALVARCAAEADIGLCGSTLRYYHAPDRIQALGGGRYDPWLGRTHLLGSDQPAQPGLAASPADLDFVHGASMLASRAFVEAAGPLEESYFLYFEELDWVARAGGAFALGHAPDSIVFHKDGGTAGSATRDPARRSRIADYHGLRSRLIYTRRHRPWALPTVWLGLIGALGNRVRRRQWDRVPMILGLMAGRR